MLLNKNKEICIFINSSDKTHDVATYFLKSYKKYINNNLLDVFIGVNKKKHHKNYKFLNYISAPKSNWQIETLFQLNLLKKKYGYKYIIHILDDFIFCKNTEINELIPFFKLFKDNNIKFLSLIKMKECFMINLLNKIKFKSKINKIRDTYPYYTSLQITLWDIEYLKKNIKSCSSIWNFERMKISNNHYQVRTNLFHYKHVVEKGEWNYGSSKYIEKYLTNFSPGNRPFRNSFFGYKIFILKKITFYFFGFLIMRIKKN